jgi:enoyl-CoA hydratase/carnithine racemase
MSINEPILIDWPQKKVLRLQLNRPAFSNAINHEMLDSLYRALIAPKANVVVLCSSTRGMFCSGADLTLSDVDRTKISISLYDLYRHLTRMKIPIVVAMSGPAVGGGAQLAVASDLRIAETTAWLRFVGPAHGLAVGAWALPSLIGRGRALDICLTGRRVNANDALAIGLIDRIADDATATALEIASELATLDSDAVARIKTIVNLSAQQAEALELEAFGNLGWSGQVAGSIDS